MKIELEINEEKIKELAQTASMNELPQAIYYEAKRQAVESAALEIKSKLVERSYYSDKESLYGEVSKLVETKISGTIKEFVDKKFNEKEIETAVKRNFERVFSEWSI